MKTCGGDDFTVKDDEELRANYATIILRCPQAVQLQNERILPYDIITKPLVLKPDMSSNLHIGHLNHKINIGLRELAFFSVVT